MKCKVCTKFQPSIEGRNNYSSKWIIGADSIRASNVKDHAKNDQHTHAMMLLAKEKARAAGQGPSAYAPIIQSFNRLGSDERRRLRFKVNTAYFIANEKLSFSIRDYVNYKDTMELIWMKHILMIMLEKRLFTLLLKSKRNELRERLKKAKFFSLLLDGSTDKGNIDNELCLVVWCDTNSSDEKIHSQMNYLTVCRPQSVTAEGLLSVLETILKHVGIDSSECHRLVGIGTDGASANIAARGLKGLVEKPLPWIFWMWCLAHHLE